MYIVVHSIIFLETKTNLELTSEEPGWMAENKQEKKASIEKNSLKFSATFSL